MFHIYAHGMKCRQDFNPNKTQGVGLLDGESCERMWSHVGLFFGMVKRMRSDSRFAVLEDVFLFLFKRYFSANIFDHNLIFLRDCRNDL